MNVAEHGCVGTSPNELLEGTISGCVGSSFSQRANRRLAPKSTLASHTGSCAPASFEHPWRELLSAAVHTLGTVKRLVTAPCNRPNSKQNVLPIKFRKKFRTTRIVMVSPLALRLLRSKQAAGGE